MIWFILIVFILFLWTSALLALAGPNMEEFDSPVGQKFNNHPDDAAADATFLQVIQQARQEAVKTRSLKGALAVVRDFADNLSGDLESDCDFKSVKANGVAANGVAANGVDCEWAIAPGADPARRVLFLHGGAFLLGSPKGHRKYAHTLSHLANAAVLSVDYRMLPEHNRMASIKDAQDCFRWILENGPHAQTKLDWLLVAGDSAGGNLTLMLSSWCNDAGLRKPDGVIAFSPNTDTTIAAKTYKTNRATDKILGQALGGLARLPKTISLWIGLLTMRCNPSNALVSPLFGNLANLAPTLIHVSDSEMMLDDSIRYTNRAQAAGSPVELQIWQGQLHDWHLFNLGTGSANSAWEQVARFINSLTPNA